jgi:hypothetical protein
VLGLALEVGESRIAAARGEKEGAITHWRKAVTMGDGLNYNEPADWYYPVRESLGAAILAAGMANDAEQVFRDDLLRNPRSLFGLMDSLKSQQRDSDAAWIEREFNEAWKGRRYKIEII